MTTTMNLIAKQTVGSGGAASVTFSNIPQTFTDLKIVISAQNTGSGSDAANMFMTVNGLTASYANKFIYGTATTVASATNSNNLTNKTQIGNYPVVASSAWGNTEVYIPNYTNSSAKSYSVDSVAEINSSTTYQNYLTLLAGYLPTTSAITTINLIAINDAFSEFSEFWLYGISSSSTQNTSVPLASGGDVIATDGTYWYHTFLYSGTFTPFKALTCDYLVVAGGGGAGGGVIHGVGGGGGGAGGYRTSVGTSGGGSSAQSALSLTSNIGYTVAVGAGGNGGVSTPTQGSSSSISGSGISTVTTTGGGYGGMWTINAGNGGSGGGASWTYNEGTGTANEGFAGGDTPGLVNAASGGGGAGGAGGQAVSNTPGAGGVGIASSISGSSITRAVGGDGGKFLEPGANGANGTANYGNGGTGANISDVSGTSWTGGNGGSGIVIVRYPVL